MSPRIYLDNNATTRPFPEVVEATARCFRDCYGNPGSRHAEGRAARKPLEEARESIAAILDADPKEVIFTSGGTEATNLAIFGCTQGEPGAIALTAGEHPATMESARFLTQSGWKLHTLAVDADGRLIPELYGDLAWPVGAGLRAGPPMCEQQPGNAQRETTSRSTSKAFHRTGPDDRTHNGGPARSPAPTETLRLVTVILAHNETGVVQDLQPLAAKCNEHGVWFHVDAVQAVGKIPVSFRELGATSLALGAHKFHGPRGVGALLLRKDAKLAPVIFGGHQEAGRRPGTEPVALAVGMAKALEIWHADRDRRIRSISELRDRLERSLLERCPPAVVNGSREHRLPNTLNIAFPGVDGEALLVALDLEGIACSLGSTCASGSAEPAPVLVAMGRGPEIYKSSARLSVGIENSAEEIDDAAERIAAVVRRLRG
jgi:cysteine desulfurase